MNMPDLSNAPSKGTIVGLLGATSIIGAVAFVDPKMAGIIAFGMLLMALLTAKFIFIRAWLRKRKAQSMASELGQQSSATPAAVSDRPQVERLEGLRKNFLAGLEKFKAAGKDIYKLPWYLIIGEPGAGKTEVIRHSDVGFPPGMQEEEFQGVGGTINMNWWFTNRAVLLDTAGRLLFEKVPAGSTGEWKEFLKLLRKHRRNCPINGLLLAIPADSLIKDPLKKVEERAGWIARQLETVQRELDIRFPVYVIITKCDLLNGFREFFEDTDDAEGQRQMLGWSNPDPLDKPYRPELVEQHMRVVVDRLREARLRLLEDPVAREATARRIDEVDQPYAFPNSVALISQNLRTYLSTLFVAGEWSAKPAFLRGIYFTSSLQEGSELDQELAEVIGVSVDDLPAGGAWKRESTFFLRDLFLEKIFPEWGLVTRASDTRRVVRQRQLTVLGTGVVALLLLLFLAWAGYNSMKESIGRQSGYWLRASEGWQPDNTWLPIVTADQGHYTYHGAEPVGSGTLTSTRELFGGGSESLVNFHATLQALTQQPLTVSAVFRPFARFVGNFDAERKRAQRIVLEGSVIEPLLDATRQKIASEDPGGDPDLERDALISLIKIEAGIVKRNNGNPQIASADGVVGPLLNYVAGDHIEYDATLPPVIAWTYSTGDGAGKWPEQWMSGGGTLQAGGPDYNQGIDMGIDQFRKNCLAKFAGVQAQWELLDKLLHFLQNDYEKKEVALWGDVNNPANADPDEPLQQLKNQYEDFRDKDVAGLDGMLDQLTEAHIFDGKNYSILAAYHDLREQWTQQSTGLLATTDDILKEVTFAETTGTGQSQLLKEIREKLQDVRGQIQNGGLPAIDENELTRLDTTFLTDPDTKHLAYKERADDYATSYATTLKDPPAGPFVGTQFQAIETVKSQIDTARHDVYAYQGEHTVEFRGLCDCWLNFAQKRQIDQCWEAYLVEARNDLDQLLHFPLVFPPEEDSALSEVDLLRAADLISTIHADLRCKVVTDKPPGAEENPARKALEDFDQHLSTLDPVLNALIVPEGKRLTVFKIYMHPGAPRAQAIAGPLNPLTNQPVPIVYPDLTYQFRRLTYNSRAKTGHGALGVRVAVGAMDPSGGESMMLTGGMDLIFHAHFFTSADGWTEVPCGSNWVVLRLLLDKKGTTDDGIHWSVNMKDENGPYPLNQDVFLDLEFEKPVPALANWPTRDQVLAQPPQ
jgi:hypothetical protein